MIVKIDNGRRMVMDGWDVPSVVGDIRCYWDALVFNTYDSPHRI